MHISSNDLSLFLFSIKIPLTNNIWHVSIRFVCAESTATIVRRFRVSLIASECIYHQENRMPPKWNSLTSSHMGSKFTYTSHWCQEVDRHFLDLFVNMATGWFFLILINNIFPLLLIDVKFNQRKEQKVTSCHETIILNKVIIFSDCKAVLEKVPFPRFVKTTKLSIFIYKNNLSLIKTVPLCN